MKKLKHQTIYDYMTHNNTYQELDDFGREKLIKLFGKKYDLTKSSDKYAHWDISGSSITGDFFIEIKDRKVKSNAYQTDLMEYSKLVNLKASATQNATLFYFCSFTDNQARMYNVTDLHVNDVVFDIMNCPASTVENKGNKQKLVINLPIVSGTTYTIK